MLFRSLHLNAPIMYDSDRRLKRDIATPAYGLAEVMALQPKSYRLNQGSDDREHLGFIAQDVQQVIPELVSEMRDGMLGVEYTGLIPVLTRAIQEQQAQIEALKGGAGGNAPAASIAKDATPPPLRVGSVGAAATSVAETWALPGAILVFAFAVAVHALVSAKTRRG